MNIALLTHESFTFYYTLTMHIKSQILRQYAQSIQSLRGTDLYLVTSVMTGDLIFRAALDLLRYKCADNLYWYCLVDHLCCYASPYRERKYKNIKYKKNPIMNHHENKFLIS